MGALWLKKCTVPGEQQVVCLGVFQELQGVTLWTMFSVLMSHLYLAKFVGFFRSLRESLSPEVVFMAYLVGRDLRTTTGRNLRLIAEETMLDPWTVSQYLVKKVLLKKATEIPEGDSWMIPYRSLLLKQGCQIWGHGGTPPIKACPPPSQKF